MYSFKSALIIILFFSFSIPAIAGKGRYATLIASTQTVAGKRISDQPVSHDQLPTRINYIWLAEMHERIKKYIPDPQERDEFLSTVFYEATRAGLDPQLVLSLIQVESGFKKYAVSSAGARGYMQIMPFWVDTIGTDAHNLFHLRVNLRYGCTILRHYLDMEKGNYFRALGRYNGSLGRDTYPKKIFNAWRKNWTYTPQTDQNYQIARAQF